MAKSKDVNHDQEDSSQLVGAGLVFEGRERMAVPVPRALVRDVRLSWAARGLYVFLWDLPQGWRPKSTHLAEMGPGGRDQMRRLLNELETVGALRMEIIRVGQQVAGSRWVLRAPHLWAVEAPLKGDK